MNKLQGKLTPGIDIALMKKLTCTCTNNLIATMIYHFPLPIFTAVYTNLEVSVAISVSWGFLSIKNLKPSINQRIKIIFSDYVMLQYITACLYTH